MHYVLLLLLLPLLSQLILAQLVQLDNFRPSRLREIVLTDGAPNRVFVLERAGFAPTRTADVRLAPVQQPMDGTKSTEAVFVPLAGGKSTEAAFGPVEGHFTITPSRVPVSEVLDANPHNWSKMTMFVNRPSGLDAVNAQLREVLSTWIRTTKGQMHQSKATVTPSMSNTVIPTTTIPPITATASTITVIPPTTTAIIYTTTQGSSSPGSSGTGFPGSGLPDDGFSGPPGSNMPPLRQTPPPTEFVDKETIFTTKPPKNTVFDQRMPTIVEGRPLGGEFIENNPLIDEDDQNDYPPPRTFSDMLKICPMYPETQTIFVHQVVMREYSAAFETRVQCRCGDGSHESFFARKQRPLLADQLTALDPGFLKSELIVGRFSCAFPGNICVQTEDGHKLRSLDWQSHVYPAVGSGGGWANSYILLMENSTKLEDVDSGKVYLGSSQFDGEKRKNRLQYSYLRIKSISCDGCVHPLTCQR